MKNATIVLFAIASFVSGCEFIAIPATNTATGSEIELCLQANLEPCPSEHADSLQD